MTMDKMFSDIMFMFGLEVKELLDRGIKLVQNRNCDEGIVALNSCLDKLRPCGAFEDLQVIAIVHIGIAHIYKRDYELAITSFEKLPTDISLEDQYVPLEAVEIFLVMAYEALEEKKYSRAAKIYSIIIIVTVVNQYIVEAVIGRMITEFRKDKKTFHWLHSCIKKHFFPVFWRAGSPYEKWSKRLIEASKREFERNEIALSIRELTFAKCLCEEAPYLQKEELLLKISKRLAKCNFKLQKSSEALANLVTCAEIDEDFYLNFWKSQESKGRQERNRYPEKSLTRFRLLSLLTTKLPGSIEWLQRIVNFHLFFGQIVIEMGSNEEAVNHYENIREYLKTYEYRHEKLAEDMKQFGNILTKKENHSFAKRMYSYALDITPESAVELKRNLLSNRSYMNKQLGNYAAAQNDASKCIKLYPNWPKGHLRLGQAYSGQKEYINAHHAFIECFRLSSSADQAEVLKAMLVNKVAEKNQKKQDAMKLPQQIAFDIINNCITLLDKDGSKCAISALNHLILNERLDCPVNVASVRVAKLIENGAPPALIEAMIKRGANLGGSPSALDLIINNLSSSKESNDIFLHLVQNGADVSKHIAVSSREPWQHIFVRLCEKLDKFDVLSELAPVVDFSTMDEKENNILHILAKMGDSSKAVRCARIITKRCWIDPQKKNQEGKRPIDLMNSDHNEMYKLLKELEKTGGKVTGNGKKKKKKKKTTQANYACFDKKEDELDSRNGRMSGGEAGINADVHDEDIHNDDVIDDKSELGSADQKQVVLSSLEEARINVHSLIETFVQAKLEDVPDQRVTERRSVSVDVPIQESIEEDEESSDDLPDEDNQDIYTNTKFQDFNDDFEGLPWDVQCTAEFWKKLKDPAYEQFKQIILRKVKLLASGDWRRRLASKLDGPAGIRLYKARLSKGARMIWEEAIAFSERRSADNIDKLGDDRLIYTDVIRLWDFTLQHDQVPKIIEKISLACERGRSSMVRKNLKVNPMLKTKDDKRLPRFYYYGNQSVADRPVQKENAKNSMMFFPPASPNDREFHILKFYAVSSAMAKCLLNSTGQSFDFPFQVNELEHQIIHLTTSPVASILLLGRSGTGKTTCCLYRLWSRFKRYWENEVTAGPHIPIIQRLFELEGSTDEDSSEENKHVGTTFEKNESCNDTDTVMACGCRNICMCVLAMARANYAGAEEEINSKEQNEIETIENDKEEGMEDGESNKSESQYRHLRQVFVTKNKVLCHEVKKNFRDLCNGFSVVQEHASSSSDEETIGNLVQIDDLSYPLFLGSRDLLLALDATLPGRPFFRRQTNGKLLVPVAGWGEKESHLSFLPVFDSDEEGDKTDDDEDDEAGEAATKKDSKVQRKATTVKREVTYMTFIHEVWPMIELKASSGYHPSLVWTEFCSFIKGTVASLESKCGYMSKDEYEQIGRKKAPNFSGDRNIIYEMFKRYRKICVDKNLFDELDVLHNVYRRLRANRIQSWLFDEIYVDETQDFTEAELFLLIHCCQDPNQLFFTGDTAQSIMRGVTFRFSDLRSLFFNAKSAFGTVKKSPVQVPGKVHQLKYNYRSHKGILKLASSIVRLMGHFFPESFDRLEDDIGLFDGPKPVILETSDFAELALMLRGARRKTSPIEFGAHQVVLVSSEERKDNLPEELCYALVLTIYEAKGLEFDDVLLYNFFKDSQARMEWRVVNSYLQSHDKKDIVEGMDASVDGGLVLKTANELEFDSRPLEFDCSKHKILNSELKQLYTALTRARVNVWIYDEDRENRAPMFNYFNKLGLVEIKKLDGESANDSIGERGMFAEESSIADWEQQGQFFYKKELWNVAYKCFKKTQNETMLKRCDAHVQAARAYKMAMDLRRKETGTLKNVYTEYMKATEIYLDCGMGDEAAICLKNAKEWRLLAELLARRQKFYEAGRNFAKAARITKDAKDDSSIKASECYQKCGDFRNATDILYHNGFHRECIDVMKLYEKKRLVSTGRLQPPRSTLSIEAIVKEAADGCVRKRNFSLLKEYLSELPMEAQLDYLRKKPGCEDMALEVLIQAGREEEAAEIYMHKENYLKAASCSKVDRTKGVCYLEHARLMWSNEDTMAEKEDSIVQFLEQAIPYLKEDPANLADCFFMLGHFKKNLQYMIDAKDQFEQCNNFVGALLCCNRLWQEGELTSDIIVAYVAKTLRQLGLKSSQTMKQLQFFFGIEKVLMNNADVFFRINKAKLRLHSDWLKCSNSKLQKYFQKNEEEDGNYCILGAAFPIADEIIKALMQTYKEQLDNTAVCYDFLQQVPHQYCKLQHMVPNAELIKERLNAYFAIIQLHGMLRQHMAPIMRMKTLAAKAREFPSLIMCNIDLMTDTCNSFYQDLTGFTRYLSQNDITGMQLSKLLPDMSYVKDQIIWCLQQMWNRAGEDGKFSDVNLFLKVYNLSVYTSSSYVQDEVDSIMDEIKERYKHDKGPRKDEVGIYNSKEKRYETFHTIFMEGKQWMHEEGWLVESFHSLLRKGMGTVLKRDVPLPSLANSVILLEFCLSQCLLALSRLNRNSIVCMPEFYVEGIQFHSETYKSCFGADYSALENIFYINFYRERSQVQLFVSIIQDLISGVRYRAFDLFQEAFQNVASLKHDTGHRADAERFLILVLVLLSNHRIFSNDPASARPVLDQLRKHARPNMEVPGFLFKALDSASRINSPEDAKLVVGKILVQSGQKMCSLNWEKVHKHYIPRGRKHMKPQVAPRFQKEEKGPEPVVLQRTKNDAVPFEEAPKIDGKPNDVDVIVVQSEDETNGDDNYFAATTEGFNYENKDSGGAERQVNDEDQHGEMLRVASYEEESYELRDNENTRRANEKRHHERQMAARKIQLWWRIISATTANLGKDEMAVANEEKFEDHCSKYASDLLCKPCGKRNASREDLRKHILEDKSHDNTAKQYDNYFSYKKNFVDPWLGTAEELLDHKFQGHPLDKHEMWEQVLMSISAISVTLNAIEMTRTWNDMNALKNDVISLQQACQKVNEQLKSLEDDNFNYEDDIEKDDDGFQPVKRRRRQKNKGESRGRGGKRH